MARGDTLNRVMTSINDRQLEFIDQKAEEIAISRAGALRQAVVRWMEQEQVRPDLEKVLGNSIKKAVQMVEDGRITIEELDELNHKAISEAKNSGST